MKTLKRVLTIVLALMAVMSFTFAAACKKSKPAEINSIFKDSSVVSYVLADDYKLSDDDVQATGGSGKEVVIGRAIAFDLAGKTLDLNGYTLKIASDVQDCLVNFKSGNIENGKLDISVPNGDIEFTDTELSTNVVYELEAASSTIRFANVKCLGEGTVKSETRVEVDYSEIGNISLSGNGTLNAGEGASFAKITIASNASGAKVNISENSTVENVDVAAKAEINIAGEVKNVTVKENATSAEEIAVKVAETAKVEKVELKAPAKVDVQGEVKSVAIAETAKTETANVEVKVSATATIQQIDMQAKTDIEVKGSIGNMVVGDKATGTTVSVTGSANVNRVVVNATETKVEGSAESIEKVVVSEQVKDEVNIDNSINTEVVEDIEEIVKPHTYVASEPVDSTCSEYGYIEYKCSDADCEDSYKVIIAKKPHEYTSEIIKYPTELAMGQRKYTCTKCGHSYIEQIQTLPLESKSLYTLFTLLIGDGSYSINLKDANITVFEELSDYTYSSATEQFIKVEVAEAAVAVKDGIPKGSIKFRVGMAYAEYDGTGDIKDVTYSADDYNIVAEFYLYLNGNDMFVEVVDGSEMFGYVTTEKVLGTILAEVFGVSSRELIEMVDAFKFAETVAMTYQPFIEALIKEASDSSATTITFEDVINVIASNVFTKEVEGENTVYTFTTEELVALVATLEGKTVKDIVDDTAGEGAWDNLIAVVKDIPDMTVGEIANLILALEENYELDIDFTISLVEDIIYDVYNVEIDLEEEINSRYDMTILDVIRVESGLEASNVELREQFNQTLEQYDAFISELTIDELFNGLVFEDPEYKMVIGSDEQTGEPIYAEETFSIIATVQGVLYMAGESANVGFKTDADGKLIGLVVGVTDMCSIEYDFVDGVYSVAGAYGNYRVVVAGDFENNDYQVEIFEGQTSIYSGEFAFDGDNNSIEAVIKAADQILAEIIAGVEIDDLNKLVSGSLSAEVMGYTVTFNADNVNGNATLVLKNGENEMGKVVVTTDEDGVVIAQVIFGGATLAEITLDETNLYTGKFNVVIEGVEFEIIVTAEKVENGLTEITIDVNPTVDGEDYNVHIELDVTTEDGEDEKTVSFDVNVVTDAMKEYFEDEQVVFDGEFVYTLNYDGNKVSSIDIAVDIDKQFAGMHGVSSSGSNVINYTINYASVSFELTVDLVNDKVADEQDFDYIKAEITKVKGVSYENGSLGYAYKTNVTDEYYELKISRYSSVYTAVVPAKNGLPTKGALLVTKDCANWVRVEYALDYYEGVSFYDDDGRELNLENFGSRYQNIYYEGFYIIFYCNLKTGEVVSDSQHEYEYSAKKLGSDCYDGLIITKTCANCDYYDSWRTNDHYYQTSYEEITTLCGTTYFTIEKCIACDDSYFGRSGGAHNFEWYSSGEATLAEIQALVSGVTAVSSAYKEVYKCSHCLLEKTRYSWYSKVDGECHYHTYEEYTFEAANGYPDQKVTNYNSSKQHDTTNEYNEVDDFANSSVCQDLIEIFGADYFSSKSAREEVTKCSLCGKVLTKEYNVQDGYVGITYHYDDNGELTGKYVYTNALWDSFASEIVNEFIKDTEITSSYVEIELNVDNTIINKHIRIHLDNDDRIYYYNNKYYSDEISERIEFYDYSECKEVYYYYENGELIKEDSRDCHQYTSWFEGVCCTEGGYRVSGCPVCGKINEKYYYNYHSYYHWGDIGKYISQTDLDSIDALEINGCICEWCGKAIDVTIHLYDDWTLTSDVFIYADDITFYLNDYTIDLNGYNLIIYSFGGSDLCIIGGNIIDSTESDSYLVAFSYDSYHGVLGYLDFTALDISVNSYVSDADNLNTIEESFYNAKGVALEGFHQVPSLNGSKK